MPRRSRPRSPDMAPQCEGVAITALVPGTRRCDPADDARAPLSLTHRQRGQPGASDRATRLQRRRLPTRWQARRARSRSPGSPKAGTTKDKPSGDAGPRGPSSRSSAATAGIAVLVLGALGVVYGDIGTSPLSAVQTVFSIDGGRICRVSLFRQAEPGSSGRSGAAMRARSMTRKITQWTGQRAPQ